MLKKKILLPVLPVLLALGAIVVWLMTNYCVINSKLYPKNAEYLDLCGQEISLATYEELTAKMPETTIRWDVPFQGGRLASDSETLTVSSLTEEDVALLAYFPNLKTLDARDCEDFSQLPTLREKYPDLEILAMLTLDGNTYDQSAKEITLSALSEGELELLPYLTQLETVTVTDGGDAANFPALREYCHDAKIGFRVVLAGQPVSEDVKELTLPNATDNQVQLLALIPQLEKIHLPEPEAKAELVLSLTEALPDTKIIWEKTVLGLTFDWDTEVIDLTPAIALGEGEVLGGKTAYDYALECKFSGTKEEKMASPRVNDKHPLPNKVDQTAQLIAEVEEAMKYFPKAEKVELYGAWLHNEDMAAFREAQRGNYKVAWSVQCGPLATRTDATFFMPTKYKIEMRKFSDLEAYNLRFCEDIECIDLGHMIITSLHFVENMPKLKYLILALTPVRDLSPLSSCKELLFLEMHWADRIVDFSPLVQCTALEDLNIGETKADIAPILEMTWLKNLWLVGCEERGYREAKKALPNTRIAYYYGNPDDGWRDLPNYFAMRDALFMYYMK